MIILYNNQKEINSAYTEFPDFFMAKEELLAMGYRIISLEENAKLRMQEGKYSFVSKNGNWVKEGILYLPKEGKFLTKKSPILTASKEEVRADEFYLTEEQRESALEDSFRLSDENFSILTKNFGKDDLAIYLFGNSAQDYGDFLKESGINKMEIWTTEMKTKPFVRQLWFDKLGVLNGLGKGPHDAYITRGILRNLFSEQ
ncbi:Uncharacterised protein [uncultured archaeon]|nr:Uncharacterised protein [uncultured archaeon]